MFAAGGREKLEEEEFRRARHVVSEIQRTCEAVQALNAGDYSKFGELMVESHNSLRYTSSLATPTLAWSHSLFVLIHTCSICTYIVHVTTCIQSKWYVD